LRFNLHGGLSPWYRGVATHFWPSYLLEPQMTGTTLHEITARIDGGAVVHQSIAPLVRGDGLHDLACRAVLAAAAELPALIEVVAGGRELAAVAQKTTGRLWLAEHWRPEHLRLVYELYGNRIVDAQLDGRLGRHQPRLVRAL
jgi:methionyl-tRNA formyltransferase